MDKTMHKAVRRDYQTNEGQIQTGLVSIDEAGRTVSRMDDELYNVIRTLETKVTMAERNGNNALIVTLDMLKEILSLLKQQEAVAKYKDCKREIENGIEHILIHDKIGFVSGRCESEDEPDDRVGRVWKKLKNRVQPCPCCHSRRQRLSRSLTNRIKRYWIKCDICHWCVKSSPTIRMAIRAWNNDKTRRNNTL